MTANVKDKYKTELPTYLLARLQNRDWRFLEINCVIQTVTLVFYLNWQFLMTGHNMSMIIVILSVLFKWCIPVPLPKLSFCGICLAREFLVGWAPSGWEGVSEKILVVYHIVLMLLVSLHLCLSLCPCFVFGCDVFELGPITEAQTEGMTTPTNLEKQLQFQPLVLCYHTVFF